MSSFLNILLFLSSFSIAVGEAILTPNDWSKPCFDGFCSYDFPQSTSSMGGRLIVSGPPHAISDITSASGWSIVECSVRSDKKRKFETVETLYVRVNCTGDVAGCNHLYLRDALNTLVRLPEDCGASPFARVAEVSKTDEGSAGLSREQGRAISQEETEMILNTDFDAFRPASLSERISFLVIGSTTSGNLAQHNTPLDNASSILQEFVKIAKNITESLPPLSIVKSVSLFNASISCPLPIDQGYSSASVGVNSSVEAALNTHLTIGIVASGTLFPPKIEQFAVFSELTGSIYGRFTLEANAVGMLDSGDVKIYSSKLPSLHISGVLSIEPSFEVAIRTKADLDIGINADIEINYQIDGLNLSLPPGSTAPIASASPRDSYLKVDVLPDLASNASIEVHVSPTLAIDITAFEDVSSFASLDVDIYSHLSLDLNATEFDKLTEEIKDLLGMESEDHEELAANGCVDVMSGISVYASWNGSAFGMWEGSEGLNVLDNQAELYHNCFSGTRAAALYHNRVGMKTTRGVAHRLDSAHNSASVDMTCPDFAGVQSQLTSIVDEIM